MMQANLKSGKAVCAKTFSNKDTRSPQPNFALVEPGVAIA